MKRILLFVVAAIAISMSTAQAQSNIFKINVISPIVRTGSVFYERTIAADKSMQLGVFYTGFSIEDTKFSGYGITPEFRKYLSKSKEAPQGFYIAPFMRYQSFNMTAEYEGHSDHTDKATFKTFGGGMLVGSQWVFADRFVLDTFFGPNYNAGSIKVESGEEDAFDTGAFGGFGIRTGIAFGIKF
ncbi:DUF3575 domain-containing protein [Pontibacter cellulosilyticus]|uniref:DUF3575 domain-containing protein n=1 Tax=Pontibacter cellulosilyticus TaxID=1720253 RepID=A0A923SPI4_9BACT|nr:DUF3575 domain-containing protein [Pontibacter cellulosilyticus]MBC5994180.1 DUF3575 domain-containing protein [Pontibacter cellulosilyticus]